MEIRPLKLQGTMAIELSPRKDARGYFGRLFDAEIWAAHGLPTAFAQENEAFTGATPSGWASTLVVILLMGGAQFMLLGILGGYVGRTLLTAGGKPQAVIRRVHGETARDGARSGT